MTRLTANHPNGRPCWVDIGVPDLRRAIGFYTALFGWEINEGPEESGRYSLCQADGATVAGIYPEMEKGAASTAWTLYFAADDAGATAERVTKAGGTIVVAVTEVPGQGRTALAEDPSGARFGLWQGQGHTGTQILGETGSMCWSELSTPDSAGARVFYSSVLGRPVEDLGVPGFDYATVKVDGNDVAGLWGVPGEPTRWSAYFAVDDADAAVARTTAAGGTVVREASDSPYGRFAMVADPFGAVFAVMRPAGS
ncbi:MAG: VOC family protein [Actinoallomurus sp.]